MIGVLVMVVAWAPFMVLTATMLGMETWQYWALWLTVLWHGCVAILWVSPRKEQS